MDIGNIHHLGYLVKEIEKTIKVFQSLGYTVEKDIFYDDIRKANLCFLIKKESRVELVEPSHESDLFSLLKKYNNAIYHVCYSVEDIDASIRELKRKGFLLFKDKQKAPAISENAIVVFLMHARMGMLELVQEGKEKYD